MIQSRCQSWSHGQSAYTEEKRRRGESTKDDRIGARLENSLPTFVSRVVWTRGIGGDVGGGFCAGVEGVRAKRKEGRAACSHGAETAALHLNDDKSRSFEDTGRLGYKRGKGVVQRPVDSQTGGRRPDQCISPVEQAEKERRRERRLKNRNRGANVHLASKNEPRTEFTSKIGPGDNSKEAREEAKTSMRIVRSVLHIQRERRTAQNFSECRMKYILTEQAAKLQREARQSFDSLSEN
ncbi:hypothetical protein K0M31_004361 [Melipona bicolor]|uniref:Uncharacterized protein n=1 Tax=Melipona bicolor TaxID=60889 RepID=A0AA40FWL6_9HYME|nr:hypothetical protein K0M31_004361 [Melipona bicolor]